MSKDIYMTGRTKLERQRKVTQYEKVECVSMKTAQLL